MLTQQQTEHILIFKIKKKQTSGRETMSVAREAQHGRDL